PGLACRAGKLWGAHPPTPSRKASLNIVRTLAVREGDSILYSHSKGGRQSSPPFDNPFQGQPSQSRLRRASAPKGGAECAHPPWSRLPGGEALGCPPPTPSRKASLNIVRTLAVREGDSILYSHSKGGRQSSPPFDNPPL